MIAVASKADLTPLRHPTPGKLWYKAMHDAGYNFGPLFQKQLDVESVSGERHSRSLVSLTEPPSEYPQSSYPMHPACIDGCFQTSSPSLWNGNRSSVNAVLVPAIIDDIIISSSGTRPETGISITSSKYVGLGRREETKNYMSEASVYDPSTGSLLFSVSGLRYHKLDTREDPYAAHNYSCVVWKPDVIHLSQHQLLDLVSTQPDANQKIGDDSSWRILNELVDLVSHKKPNLKVMEASLIPGHSKSLWLHEGFSNASPRAAYRKYHFSSVDATALIAAQEKYGALANTNFTLLDMTKAPGEFQVSEADFDLLVVRLVSFPIGRTSRGIPMY